MGQYYKPIFLNEKNKPIAFVNSHDFASGLKLMEHSWMKNDFVGFVEKHLAIQPQKIVWAGDYADVESNKEENLYELAESVGRLTHSEEVENKYLHEFEHGKGSTRKRKYLINFDKKEFVDKSKTPTSSDGWQIHPLPLMTCEGNGRGGGDFRGCEKNLLGRWSRDKIGVGSRKSDIPTGFTEIIFDLTE